MFNLSFTSIDTNADVVQVSVDLKEFRVKIPEIDPAKTDQRDSGHYPRKSEKTVIHKSMHIHSGVFVHDFLLC